MASTPEINNTKSAFEADESKILIANPTNPKEEKLTEAAKLHMYKVEKKIGELRYSNNEVNKLTNNVKKDLMKQHDMLMNELTNILEKQVMNDIKEMEKRLNAIKEIDKKFTEDLTKNLSKLSEDLGNTNKTIEEINEKLTKSEKNFGKIENADSNNI